MQFPHKHAQYAYSFADVHVAAVLYRDLALLGGQWAIGERSVSCRVGSGLLPNHKGLPDAWALRFVQATDSVNDHSH